jgi:hypothetical protein
MLVLEKKRLNHGKDLMHRYATDGHVCKDKCMVRSSSCSIKWPIYVVIWLTHNYKRFEIVLTQVTSMSLLNIIKDRILRSQTNSALSRSWIVWWGVNIFLDFTPFFCHKHALLGFFSGMIWSDVMARASIGERNLSTKWSCTLVEVERVMDSEIKLLC